MATPDWQRIRGEFPALSGRAYLDTATYGQTPRRAVQAVMDHFARRDAEACGDFLTWFDDADRIRCSVASLINCGADDVAFVPSASTALGWLLNGIRWNPGDRVLALAGEFPNNLYSPANLASHGVDFQEVSWEQLQELNDRRVRLVLVSSLNYITGFQPPLEQLSTKLRGLGTLLYVDGTQGLGALRLDVSAVQPDMLAVHAYKWLLSPNGAGFAYISPALRKQLEPTVVGWRSDRGWRNVNHLHHGAPQFAGAAERYEGGMLSFPCLYAMGASVEMMLEIGPDLIEARVLDLAERCASVLKEAGGVLAFEGTPILSACFPGVDAAQLASSLKTRGVMVSARHGALRVSTHFYNNQEDLLTLRDALSDTLPKLRK